MIEKIENPNLFQEFSKYTIFELEEFLNKAEDREETLFYQRLSWSK